MCVYVLSMCIHAKDLPVRTKFVKVKGITALQARTVRAVVITSSASSLLGKWDESLTTAREFVSASPSSAKCYSG